MNTVGKNARDIARNYRKKYEKKSWENVDIQVGKQYANKLTRH